MKPSIVSLLVTISTFGSVTFLCSADSSTPITPPDPKNLEKRPRQFVGKRDTLESTLRDLLEDEPGLIQELDKRPRQFVGKRSLEENLEELSSSLEMAKRPRQFVGKRDYLDALSSDLEKRPRQFVGKREYDVLQEQFPGFLSSTPEKRPRQFVGKRDQNLEEISGQFFDIPSADVDKRPRQFVGKRMFGLFGNMLPQQSRTNLAKRPRQFVGKRNFNFDNLLSLCSSGSPLDLNKRPRQFVGKRDAPSDEIIGFSAESIQKRPRQFVGKRNSGLESIESNLNLQKRPRQFVGKRNSHIQSIEPFILDSLFGMDKRPRQFVGKRTAMNLDKRPRQFVGKRSSLDNIEVLGNGPFLHKRPRQFVGKRAPRFESDPDLYAEFLDSPQQKRIREFVGKRNALHKRPRQFVGKRSSVAFEFPDDLEQENLQKRPRQFVGKKRGDTEITEDIVKQIWDVLDQRASLNAEELSQELRQHLEKGHLMKADKRPRQFVGKRETLTAADAGRDGDVPVEYLSSNNMGSFIAER